MPAPAADPRIPVTLITGFLGAGKSTLLNALLDSPGFAGSAVLVNEFGDVGIDSALIRAVDGNVVTLSTGCVCCAPRGELIDALKDLHFKRVRGRIAEFGRLVIETSGLADPAPILATLLREPVLAAVYRIDGIVAVIDGEHGAAHLDERNEARVQAAVADRLLISKTDRIGAAEVETLAARLRALNPLAEIIPMRWGEVPAEALTGGFDPARADAFAE
ncbi:MAG: GTP-binding protein, partial [Rhodospirillaceae bacterium]